MMRFTQSILRPHKSLSEQTDQQIKKYQHKKDLGTEMQKALEAFKIQKNALFQDLIDFAQTIDKQPDASTLNKLPPGYIQAHLSITMENITQFMASRENLLSSLPKEYVEFKDLINNYCAQTMAKIYRFTLSLLETHDIHKPLRKPELLLIIKQDTGFNEIYDECLPLAIRIKTWNAANAYHSTLCISVNRLITLIKENLCKFEPDLIPKSVWRASVNL